MRIVVRATAPDPPPRSVAALRAVLPDRSLVQIRRALRGGSPLLTALLWQDDHAEVGRRLRDLLDALDAERLPYVIEETEPAGGDGYRISRRTLDGILSD